MALPSGSPRPTGNQGKGRLMLRAWIEVWIDNVAWKYVLVVRPIGDGRVEICDPQESWKVVGVFDNYEQAEHWLGEDEYDLVEGRLLPP